MAKPPTKARKGKRPADAAASGPPAPARAAEKAGPAKAGKAARSAGAPAEEPARRTTARKPAAKAAGKPAKKLPKKSPKTAPGETVAAATPVVIRGAPTEAAASLPDVSLPAKAGRKSGKGGAGRRPPRQTFLVAATHPQDADTPRLGVYAVVTRTPAEALAAVRDLLGADVPVGLTGKLSGRMAKALGLRPGEVVRI